MPDSIQEERVSIHTFRSRAAAALALVLLLAVSPAAFTQAGQYAEPKGGKNLSFEPGGGYDSSFTVTIPKNATVLEASINVSGLLGGPLVYEVANTYTDLVNNSAWSGTTAAGTPAGAPAIWQGTAFTAGEYSSAEASDDARVLTDAAKPLGQGRAYHHFGFIVSTAGHVALDLSWEGWGESDGTPAQSAGLYVYNLTSAAWELKDSYAVTDSADHVLTWSHAGTMGDYVVAGGNVDVLVLGPARAGNNGLSRLYSDYVRLNVTYHDYSYPSDVTMDVGDDHIVDWVAGPGEFSGFAVISDAEGLKSDLQAFVNSAGTGPGNVVIPFNFTSSSHGVINVSDINVVWNMPPVASVIPDTYSLDEDTNAPGLIDLDSYFDDDDGVDGLTYSITWVEDPEKLDAGLTVDGNGLDFFTNTPDWHGTASFSVRATDAHGRFVDGNTFTVTVLPVNDAPAIVSVGAADTSAACDHALAANLPEDAWTNVTVRVEDPDGDDVVLGSDLSWDAPGAAKVEPARDGGGSVVPGEFVLSFFPLQEHVGPGSLTLTADDGNETGGALLDVLNVTFNVINSKDAPVFDAVPDLEVAQNALLEHTFTATDEDSATGAGLYYDTNATDGANDDDLPHAYTDSGSGEFTFTPTNDEVGVHHVRATVTDGDFVVARDFTITVTNVNDPPVANLALPLDRAIFEEGANVTLDASGTTDPDLEHPFLGETLSYEWTSNVSGALGSGDFLVVAIDEPGLHTITLTVTDSGDEVSVATVGIEVLPLPDDDGTAGDGDGGDDGGGDGDGTDGTDGTDDGDGGIDVPDDGDGTGDGVDVPGDGDDGVDPGDIIDGGGTDVPVDGGDDGDGANDGDGADGGGGGGGGTGGDETEDRESDSDDGQGIFLGAVVLIVLGILLALVMVRRRKARKGCDAWDGADGSGAGIESGPKPSPPMTPVPMPKPMAPSPMSAPEAAPVPKPMAPGTVPEAAPVAAPVDGVPGEVPMAAEAVDVTSVATPAE